MRLLRGMMEKVKEEETEGVMSLQINIPGGKAYEIDHLVLDYNGTLAHEGQLLDVLLPALRDLSDDLEIHIVTADTFGSVIKNFEGTGINVVVIEEAVVTEAKADYVRKLGAEAVMAVGNGKNDVDMLSAAAIGVGIMGQEGIAKDALMAADVVFGNIHHLLKLLKRNHPGLVATLRH